MGHKASAGRDYTKEHKGHKEEEERGTLTNLYSSKLEREKGTKNCLRQLNEKLFPKFVNLLFRDLKSLFLQPAIKSGNIPP